MEKQEPAVIFCDESKHNGNNLLDNEQPIFVYATVHISDDIFNTTKSFFKKNIDLIDNGAFPNSFKLAFKNMIFNIFTIS